MIKRLLLPDWSRTPQRPVQAVRGRRLNPLQNLNQAVKISVQIAKRRQQKVHMIRHDHDRVNRSLRSLIMQAMPQHNIPDRFRQRIEAAAKRDKQTLPDCPSDNAEAAADTRTSPSTMPESSECPK